MRMIVLLALVAVACGEPRAASVEVRRPDSHGSGSEAQHREPEGTPGEEGRAGAEATVEPTPSARRELGTLPPELAELRWPEPPRVAREVVAGDHATLQAAVDAPGTRVRVTASIAEPIVVHASDVEIRIDAGARLERVVIDPGVRRVRVAGGRAGGFELLPPARWSDAGEARWDESLFVEDVVLEGMRIDAADSAFVVRGRRVAILDNEVDAARYALWAGDTGPLDGRDLIVVGNTFRAAGPESTLRMHDVVRSVVVENVLANGEKHNYRVHGRSDLAFAARNTLVRTGLMLGTQPGDAVGTIVFVDNVLHHDVPSLLELEMQAIRRLVCRGNTVYTDRWDAFYPYPRVPAGWTIEGNTRLPYRPWAPPR